MAVAGDVIQQVKEAGIVGAGGAEGVRGPLFFVHLPVRDLPAPRVPSLPPQATGGGCRG